MVDRDRVLRVLERITRDVGVLAAARDRPNLLDDDIGLGAVKYYFVTAIEGCAKVAHHLAAAEDWPLSETNGDAVRMLGDRGVVDRDLARRLGSAVGFRNLLVHGYAEVDDARTVAHLDELDDLAAFTHQVAAWLAARP